jgi:hypothetical protein
MIRNNQQLKMAQQAILNLQKILLQARIVHYRIYFYIKSLSDFINQIEKAIANRQ